MAHTTSTSRKPKRSTASSIKDATLGKKVVPDPRVRVHSSKAARDNGRDHDDSDDAGPSNSSSSTLNSSSTLVDSSNTGPSAPPRKPNWKRVTLKRSIPHSMLTRPCGPGKIIMPSVPRRPKPKPDGEDDGDATDKEPESETSAPQPSSTASAAASTALATAVMPTVPSSTTASSTTLPSTVIPTSSSVAFSTTTNSVVLPSATPSSTILPATSQLPLVAPVVQLPRDTGLNTEQMIRASGMTFNNGPLDRDLNCPSGINTNTATYNLAPTMPPLCPSDIIDESARATSMSYDEPAAATPSTATHSSITMKSGFVEHCSKLVEHSFQSVASSTGSNSQARDLQPFAPTIPPVFYSGTTNETMGATSMSGHGVAAATHSSITLNSGFAEQHYQSNATPVEFDSQARDTQPFAPTIAPVSPCGVANKSIGATLMTCNGVTPVTPNPPTHFSITLNSGFVEQRIQPTSSAGEFDSQAQPFLDANARLLDVDEEMGEPEPYHSHTSAPAIVWQQPPKEVQQPQFNALNARQQPPPPCLAPQPNQTIQYQHSRSGNEAQNHNLNFSQNHHQTTSLNQYGTFPQHQAWAQNRHTDNGMSAGGMTPTNYHPPAVESQWQPHIQFSSSLPSLYTPTALYSDATQAHPPTFYPAASYPLLTQLQPVNADRSYGLQDASSSSRSYLLPKRKSTPPPQIKTSLPPEDATEWNKKIAEVYKPRPINPFAPFHQGRPMLIPKIDELEPRLYCPLPSRSGTSTSTGRRPPVGSEEDLIARLALERKYQAEEERRALRREKRRKRDRSESLPDKNEELPVKKQKVRSESTVSRKESAAHRALPIVPRPPVRAPSKPVNRTRSCPSISKLVKVVLRW